MADAIRFFENQAQAPVINQPGVSPIIQQAANLYNSDLQAGVIPYLQDQRGAFGDGRIVRMHMDSLRRIKNPNIALSPEDLASFDRQKALDPNIDELAFRAYRAGIIEAVLSDYERKAADYLQNSKMIPGAVAVDIRSQVEQNMRKKYGNSYKPQ